LALSPAGAAPLLQNALNRHTFSLNGDWHAIVDSRDYGVARRYFQNLNPFTSPGVVEYDFATAPALHVPGDWNSQKPELLLYEGTGLVRAGIFLSFGHGPPCLLPCRRGKIIGPACG